MELLYDWLLFLADLFNELPVFWLERKINQRMCKENKQKNWVIYHDAHDRNYLFHHHSLSIDFKSLSLIGLRLACWWMSLSFESP